MKSCIFCQIIKKGGGKNAIYNDNKTLAILDEDWVVKGHCLVIWKKHLENASELPLEDFLHFSKIFHKTEKVLLDTLKKEKSVILKSGGLVSHFHLHIYPVSSSMTWQEIKDLFDKKKKYQPTEEEKEELISLLRRDLCKLG